jgi:metal-responsive CopG/Arc/MetJ family transcriptional regulator
MRRIQLSIGESILESIDRMAAESGISRSEIVREALKHWVRKNDIRVFEREWIKKLKESPDDLRHADKWMKVQLWGVP